MWGQVQRGDVAAKVLEHFRGNIRGAWTRAPFVRVARGTLPRTGRAGGLSHTGLRNGYGGGLNEINRAGHCVPRLVDPHLLTHGRAPYQALRLASAPLGTQK